MEPMTNVEKVHLHLNEIRENFNKIDEETWSADIVESLLRSYDALNEIDLERVKVGELLTDFEEVNEQLEKLCQEHIFGGIDEEEQLLDKIHEFQEHINSTVKKLFEEVINPDDDFSQLPVEMKLRVLDYLDPSDMENVVALSRHFKRVGQESVLLENKGVYSKRLEKALKDNPKPWETPEFSEKYKEALQNVRSLDLRGIPHSSELFIFIKMNCPRIKHLVLSKHVTDDMLASIPNNLTSLDLRSCRRITDAGLSHLSGLTNLTSLNLSRCHSITDAGLSHLSGLTNLTSLDLTFCRRITDAGLSHLSALNNLTSLVLTGILRTNEGLSYLSGLTNLTSLDLSKCRKLTDAGLPHLSGLKNLTSLNLAFTGITDTGLPRLSSLENLTSLDLTDTNITDAGLPHLSGLKNLTSLNLAWCHSITDEGLSSLNEKVKVNRNLRL